MSAICPSTNCPLCSGEQCNVCGDRIATCTHSSVTRHGMPAIEREIDKIVADDPAPEPLVSRVPTKPMPPLAAKNIVFELDGSGSQDLIEFFRMGADVIAATTNNGRCRVTITVERVPVEPPELEETPTPSPGRK